MKLAPGNKITACLVEIEMGPCLTCNHTGSRILVIRSASGDKRRITLCAQHFAEACAEYPELRDLERFRLASRSTKSEAMG